MSVYDFFDWGPAAAAGIVAWTYFLRLSLDAASVLGAIRKLLAVFYLSIGFGGIFKFENSSIPGPRIMKDFRLKSNVLLLNMINSIYLS